MSYPQQKSTGREFTDKNRNNFDRAPAHARLPLTKQVPEARSGQRIRIITVKLTEQELKLLMALASDQLFRREFIDPKMPGYKLNPAELNLGKKLVERLRSASDPAKRMQPRMSLIE